MKKKFTEILDELSPEELDTLLAGVEESADEITSARINAKVKEKTFVSQPKQKTAGRLPKRAIWAIAACIALVFALGIGTYAYAAEAREYKAAKEFFMENGLETAGLTRSEIKAVYLDIKTERFTYGKTAEVIAHSLVINSVPGYELNAELRSREEVENAWLDLRNAWLKGSKTNPWTGAEYASKYGYYSSPVFSDDGSLDVTATDFERKDGDKTLWSVRIDGISSFDLIAVTDGVIATGHVAEKQSKRPVIVKISDDGEILWRRDAYLDSDWWSICTTAELNNGDLAFFGLVSSNAETDPDDKPIWDICYVRYSSDGELKQAKSGYVGDGYPRLAVPFGNGCLVALDGGKVFSIDENGVFSDIAVYSEEGREYRVKDMLEYEGSLYLSCYSYPVQNNGEGMYEEMSGVRCEATVEEILDWFKEHKDSDELRNGYCDDLFISTLRENYKAILLKIDPESPEPEVFYSVDGAFGSSLEIDKAGGLVWYVENISSAGLFPMLNSHSVEILCSVTRCGFDRSGALIGIEDTGEISKIWR